ncbi:cinnamycin family lantibiotic [Actinomadura hibisca]|uniref:cinnamycin family lantibiotic n=1 Tax=Actinomadura hibisca TaxID=68565 RepID=UPI000ADF5C1E|nr:cinnamycin family lantibiotic [Actinomadura hibisca]
MNANTLEPRDAGIRETAEFDQVFFATAEGADHYSPQTACISTCISGWTIRCDGRTFD